MGNGSHGQWGTGGMRHMGNDPHWGYGGTGVWGTWAIGMQGVWGTRGMGHAGNGIHGQWGTGVWTTWAMGPMGNLLPKYQKDVKLSKRCQVVKKMSSCQKDVKCQKMKHLDYGGGSQKN